MDLEHKAVLQPQPQQPQPHIIYASFKPPATKVTAIKPKPSNRKVRHRSMPLPIAPAAPTNSSMTIHKPLETITNKPRKYMQYVKPLKLNIKKLFFYKKAIILKIFIAIFLIKLK